MGGWGHPLKRNIRGVEQVFLFAKPVSPTSSLSNSGNRISQTLNDCLTTRFVYDGADVVMELNASNQVIWAWVNAPGLDQPVERIAFINGEARNRQVFHADGLGSIAVLTDESGEPVQTYTYAAFGSIRTQTGTDPFLGLSVTVACAQARRHLWIASAGGLWHSPLPCSSTWRHAA